MDSVIRKRAEEQFRVRREKSEGDALKKVVRAPLPPFSRQKEDYKINDLPNLQRTRNPSFEMYGGHLPSTTDSESNSHLYFAMVEARQKTDKARTIFWFNGGPGCSSFDALMMEVGPFNLIKNEKGELGLKEKDYGWHEYANIVFIDQPVGTGYSYAQTDSYVHELDQAADQFITFLNNFYEIFPELKNTDTYISGESYAGQYVPYFGNKVIETPDLPLNLKGLIIGNGWIDPISQYPAYAQFAHDEGLIQPDTKADKEMMDTVTECEKSINLALIREEKTGVLPIYISVCELIMDHITGSHRKYENGKATCLNSYDYRLRDEYPACGMNWPNELHDVTEYLRKESVTKAFNARARAESWTECNVKVSRELTAVHSTASVRLLPKILKHTKVLLFAGDKDIICNYQGIENLVDNLEWNGGKGFSDGTPQLWSMHDNPVGEWQSERNLTYVRVYNASHMAPIDAPEPMLDLITRYMEVDLKSVKSSDDYNFESAVGDINEFGEEDSSVGWAGSHKKSGSFALLLIIIGVAVGGFLWIRRRRRQMLVHDYSQLRANTLSQEQEQEQEQEQGIEISNRRSNEQIESERLFDVGSDIDSDESDSNKHRE